MTTLYSCPRGRLLTPTTAFLASEAVVAGGRKVAQWPGKVASLNERRHGELQGGSIHADATQLRHQ
jgi:hypothetical protein